MKLSIVLFAAVFLGVTSLAWSQDHRWTVELSGGYNLGTGPGVGWTTSGASDPTHIFSEKTLNATGNSGFDGEIRLGYDFFPPFGITLAGSVIGQQTELKSVRFWDSSGNVTTNWSERFTYAVFRITPAARVWVINTKTVKLFGSVGPMLVLPAEYEVDATNPADSTTFKSTLKQGLGYGVQCEWGAEFPVTDSWGVTVDLDFEKAAIPPKTYETSDSAGNTTTINYSDSPSTNSDNQTQDDVAKSTSTHTYKTYPTAWNDYSNVGMKVGVIWHL